MQNMDEDQGDSCERLGNNSETVLLDREKLFQRLAKLGCTNYPGYKKLCKAKSVAYVGKDQFTFIRTGRPISRGVADTIVGGLEACRLLSINKNSLSELRLVDLLQSVELPEPIGALTIEQPDSPVAEDSAASLENFCTSDEFQHSSTESQEATMVDPSKWKSRLSWTAALAAGLVLAALSVVPFNSSDAQKLALEQIQSRLKMVPYESNDVRIDTNRQQKFRVEGVAKLAELTPTEDGEYRATFHYAGAYTREWNILNSNFLPISEKKFPVGKATLIFNWNGTEFTPKKEPVLLIPDNLDRVSSNDAGHDSNRLTLIALEQALLK